MLRFNEIIVIVPGKCHYEKNPVVGEWCLKVINRSHAYGRGNFFMATLVVDRVSTTSVDM